MHCSACNSPNPDEARFCLQCGGALHRDAAALPTDQERVALTRALGANYEIVRLLGRGGMGSVYLARERALERAVAIKVLPPKMAADADGRERFRREARTAAQLTHPNIVPLHTFGEADGMLYFVMGYVRGESLGDRMRREGKLPADDVRSIMGEIAGALDYAHRQGVIHRDIKPDNVLLDDESGRPMLTDFGVAKAQASGATLTEIGAVVGTPHYMSPEQASGARDLDGRSDLYSLGVMGYVMLGGRLPFEGDSFRDVIVQQVTKEPPPLRSIVPDVAVDLEAAVTRCMAKDPSARWKDGLALKEALGLALADDEDSLPGELREVSSALFWSVTAGWVLGSVGWLNAGALGALRWAVAIGAASIVPVGYLITAAVHQRKGFSWSQMARVAKWPPTWWPFGWPLTWRRPSDVWERLPRGLRTLRLYYGVLALAAVLVAPFWFSSAVFTPFGRIGVVTGLLVMVVIGMIGAAAWAARARFPNNADLRSLVFGSATHKRFWKKPDVARLLQPVGLQSATSLQEPRTAPELERAVLSIAQRLGGPRRDVGADAISAARHVVAALEQLDEEIALLARDASQGEIATVEQKLKSLGAAAGEPAARRELRAMLTHQHELLKRLADQLSVTTHRRERLFDLLRTLWLEMASLPADSAPDVLADGGVTTRIRAAVAEIGVHIDAAATMRIDGAASAAPLASKRNP